MLDLRQKWVTLVVSLISIRFKRPIDSLVLSLNSINQRCYVQLSFGRGNFDRQTFPDIGVNAPFSCAFVHIRSDVFTYETAVDDCEQVTQIEQLGDGNKVT